MPAPASPNSAGRHLVHQLRELREKAGLTQEEAGPEAHIRVQKLSRIENGQVPSWHELLVLLAVYGVPEGERAPLEDLLSRARTRRTYWWSRAQYGKPACNYFLAEHEASTVTESALGVIPALLRTPAYAKALARHLANGPGTLTVADEIEIVRQRQKLLTRTPDPLTYHAILHEPLLHQQTTHTQLAHLVDLASCPNVTIQIIPQGVGLHIGLIGPMTLLTFPDLPDRAFTIDNFNTHREASEAETASFALRLKRLQANALTPELSLNVLNNLRKLLTPKGSQ